MSSSFGNRSRPPPPPLRLQKSTFRPSSTAAASNQQLLYDLPSASSISSPPHNSQFLTSPTTPRSRGNAGGIARRTPPPLSAQARSLTPQPFHDDDLDQFSGYCHAWYYDQDDAAGRQMTQRLATLPPSQRAQYARIQASIRAAYHASLSARRTAEFQAHLSATQCGGSLMLHSRADPGGTVARKERHVKLERFVRNWCNAGMPGTKPFFEAFWALLRLQVLPEHLGGAGNRRIEWEFDDAVFMESAGKDFMLEAVDVIKGVLGFDENQSSRRSQQFCLSKDNLLSRIHSRTQSEPLTSKSTVPPRRQKPMNISSTTHTSRPRAPSDPFLDTVGTMQSMSAATSRVSSGKTLTPGEISPTDESIVLPNATTVDQRYGDQCEVDYLRTWTAPDLSNPELTSLLAVFPAFVSARTLPRFAVTSDKRGHADLEGSGDPPSEGVRDEVRFGTGVMWVGEKERTDGWRGGWWERFSAWWRQILCSG